MQFEELSLDQLKQRAERALSATREIIDAMREHAKDLRREDTMRRTAGARRIPWG